MAFEDIDSGKRCPRLIEIALPIREISTENCIEQKSIEIISSMGKPR